MHVASGPHGGQGLTDLHKRQSNSDCAPARSGAGRVSGGGGGGGDAAQQRGQVQVRGLVQKGEADCVRDTALHIRAQRSAGGAAGAAAREEQGEEARPLGRRHVGGPYRLEWKQVCAHEPEAK
mmetsp:Transcript_54196/g.141692  ORF Transcript_54196/g.141692 Transcript_54196/m.141692 type:complete len:123 (-) Transcript_54196:2653-3021(-)